MNDINTTQLSDIAKTRTGEQNDRSMSEDKFVVGKNLKSFEYPDIDKKEIDELKLVEKDIKLNYLTKLLSQRQHDNINKNK